MANTTNSTFFIGSDEIIQTASQWLEQGQQVALATVVRTWGSSPRPLGSQLVVSESGEFEGSVSGGCIEGAVVKEAQESIESGTPRLVTFGVADADAWEVGLSCGGEVHVHVQKVDKDYLKTLSTIRPLTLVTNLKSGDYAFIDGTTVTGPLPLDQNIVSAAQEALIADKCRTEDDLFIHVLNLPLRMIVVGAVHIAQALVPMAKIAGFDVTVVDPRRAFATQERFPEATVSNEWPDDALNELKPDARTAVITLSHDPKIDDPALQVALKSPAFYIGSLGSRRTHGKRVERLSEEGFNETEIGRINAPGGLDLGAKSPAEIAVSMLAEAIAVKYGKKLKSQ
ncbi:MAG: XdhC family protein [Rhodospirillales bacterium]|nr:XdhC family protein [Rhodospirillales bacterium]